MGDVPPAVVTRTSTTNGVPATPWAGELTVRFPASATLTPVPRNAPNVTEAPGVKLVPETVTGVPPASGPFAGATPVTVGGVKPPPLPPPPPPPWKLVPATGGV